ncbi:hypothetical protein [Paenibacillus sp. RC84]|uniref:hypothetical protein n=1 Tax=Paenibacillus sp. RC84 TaxID=3156252 RepID=UPI0035171E2E
MDSVAERRSFSRALKGNGIARRLWLLSIEAGNCLMEPCLSAALLFQGTEEAGLSVYAGSGVTGCTTATAVLSFSGQDFSCRAVSQAGKPALRQAHWTVRELLPSSVRLGHVVREKDLHRISGGGLSFFKQKGEGTARI